MQIVKVSFEDWFTQLVTEKTAELRAKLAGEGKSQLIKDVETYFRTGDLTKSSVRLNALKTFAITQGIDMSEVTLESLDKKMDSVRFSIMAIKNGSGFYDSNYFLVTRALLGYSRNGETGDCFPDSTIATWIAPSEADTQGIIKHFIQLSYKDNDFREMIEVWKSSIDIFVDFTLFNAKGVEPILEGEVPNVN